MTKSLFTEEQLQEIQCLIESAIRDHDRSVQNDIASLQREIMADISLSECRCKCENP